MLLSVNFERGALPHKRVDSQKRAQGSVFVRKLVIHLAFLLNEGLSLSINALLSMNFEGGPSAQVGQFF